MRRAFAWLLVIGLGVLALAVVYGYQRLGALQVKHVAGDVHVLFGTGGNVGVLATEAGAVVVDTLMFRMLGERVREHAEAVAGGPVQVVINTHYHRDHTHGNPAFARGLQIVATRRTRDLMTERDTDYWLGANETYLPSVVFDERNVLQVGGKTVELLHPGRGHTGGDLVVLFREDGVVHLGDLFFHGRYPRLDLEGGGSLAAWIETLDRVLELEFDHVIPGHGPVGDRAALVAFQAFLREVWGEVRKAAAAGRSLEETLATARLTRDTGLESTVVPFVVRIDRETLLSAAWREASGAPEPGAP